MGTSSDRGGLDVDWEDLLDIGEITLPYVADFYDEIANRLSAIGDFGSQGLLPRDAGPAGNALAEAVVRGHRFLYAVAEETADSHRAVGRSVREAALDYKDADESNAASFEMTGGDLTGSVAEEFEAVDAGEYDYDSSYRFGNFNSDGGSRYEEALSGEPVKPVDHQDFEIENDPVFQRSELNDRGGDRGPAPKDEKG